MRFDLPAMFGPTRKFRRPRLKETSLRLLKFFTLMCEIMTHSNLLASPLRSMMLFLRFGAQARGDLRELLERGFQVIRNFAGDHVRRG